MDIPHTLCTQLLDETINHHFWMGLMMFGLGLCLGIWYGKGTEWEKNNQKEQKTNI